MKKDKDRYTHINRKKLRYEQTLIINGVYSLKNYMVQQNTDTGRQPNTSNILISLQKSAGK